MSATLSENKAPLAVALSVRRLVEFLLRTGSIDSRFSGFDRANEGARIHRRLQRAAAKVHEDYKAEVALRQEYTCDGITYTLEGRADGIFTRDGVPVVEEIKSTTLPLEEITENHAPEHWAQGQVYAAIYALQNDLPRITVLLTYFQVDEELTVPYEHTYTAEELDQIVQNLLHRYAPWARLAADWQEKSREGMRQLAFPFPTYRPGQRAMISEVYTTCRDGGQLLCQAPTGIGKTMSVLFPALKALGNGVKGPVFYLTARGTTRAAAEDALNRFRTQDSSLPLRSVTLTAKDKICLCETRECTPEACPYANGYYDRIKDALWDALDDTTGALNAAVLQEYARKHRVCPFEMGLDLSLWSDVIIGDYNYLFDPVVRLQRFFESKGDYLFLVDEAHNLPDRAREMHSASLEKASFYQAKKNLGKGKSSLKTALSRVNDHFIEWRHRCEEAAAREDARFGQTLFMPDLDESFDRLLTRLCEQLEIWLDEHRDPSEQHSELLQLYFDARAWLRVAETFDDHFVLQISAYGSQVRASLLCLDPSNFLASDFSLGRAAVLFSATLAPAAYYKDLCGLENARAVALRSPFPQQNMALLCAQSVSTRYRDREKSIPAIADYLATMVRAQTGNYLAFFPSYAYLDKVYDNFCERYPDLAVCRQESAMEEDQRAAFLERFAPSPSRSLLGFAVLGGVFGEGVDLAGDRLIGVAVIGPGLPQVGARQEQLRDHFEQTRGCGFDYAYRYPGMNKVLQAAGRLIRTPTDRGVVLLFDDRFVASEYLRLMPPHWSHLRTVYNEQALQATLEAFWQMPATESSEL
ncbi:ATP-dependent DNA helicase [Gemmiger formicilis]|nr:ATP-dependent DNA helicase [Gemmiger formicilis]MBM6716648.1 ATP-dependent DNA helicase [Gemmiger formicilis]